MCICTTESGIISCCIIRVHLVSKSYRSLLVINKMDKSLHCCVFLMLNVLAATCTVTVAEIITKFVCEGDSVPIFQNISLARLKKITLYKNGTGKETPIAVWFWNHSDADNPIDSRYKSKVLFVNGIITLHDIESTDEATYFLSSDNDNSSKIQTHISILVAPTSPCKPKLIQEQNHLIAVLDNEEYCGHPTVSVQWMEYPDISYKDKAVIEVPPGKDACTYYACMEGEALRCTRNSTERKYCEHITIGSTRRDNIPITGSDIHYLMSTNGAAVGLVSLVLIALIAATIITWKCCRIGPKLCESSDSPEERASMV